MHKDCHMVTLEFESKSRRPHVVEIASVPSGGEHSLLYMFM